MPQPDRAPSAATRRVQHIFAGIFLVGGAGQAVLAVVTGAHHIHGYGDLFAFLGSLAAGLLLVYLGWRMAA